MEDSTPQDDHDDSSTSTDDKNSSENPNSEAIVAVGTYDGSIAAFEIVEEGRRLKMFLASPVHEGSVRSLAFSHHPNESSRSCIMVSTGYDDVIKPHDFGSRRLSTGDIRTTSIMGTPTVAAFAPPPGRKAAASTHCLVGFGEPAGQLVLYKRNTKWTAQHILNGHEGGISALAVHPTGKLAISCGRRDGKIKLWDLERGRLAYTSAHASPLQNTMHDGTNTTKHYECIDCIVWKPDEADANCYAFSYGSHITVRTTLTGKDLLDVDLPNKVNEICLMDGPDGLFVVAACNDGSLPVLMVEEEESDSRRAIMAMEPSDGNERFKFIQYVSEYRIVVGSSTGVVHLMDLQGAVRMILNPREESDGESETARDPNSRKTEQGDEGEEEELAVDLLDAQMVGSGARITSLAVWRAPEKGASSNTGQREQSSKRANPENTDASKRALKRKADVELDDEAIERARTLVSKAKKIQKKRSKRKSKTN